MEGKTGVLSPVRRLFSDFCVVVDKLGSHQDSVFEWAEKTVCHLSCRSDVKKELNFERPMPLTFSTLCVSFRVVLRSLPWTATDLDKKHNKQLTSGGILRPEHATANCCVVNGFRSSQVVASTTAQTEISLKTRVCTTLTLVVSVAHFLSYAPHGHTANCSRF